MANMIATEHSNIVAIANAVRNRTGENGDLTIGEIISGINSIEGGENLDAEITAQNVLIAEQDAKIAELAEVLAGKASGGNNSENVETWTGSIIKEGILPPLFDYYGVLYYTNNLLEAKMLKITDLPTTITIAKNTLFYITGDLHVKSYINCTSLETPIGNNYHKIILPTSDNFSLSVSG